MESAPGFTARQGQDRTGIQTCLSLMSYNHRSERQVIGRRGPRADGEFVRKGLEGLISFLKVHYANRILHFSLESHILNSDT